MALSDVPRSERPREKLLHQGASALTDAELLAIFIRTGTPGRSALQIAHDIIDRHGGLVELLHTDEKSFCDTKGLGPAKYAQLSAILEMARRYETGRAGDREFLESPEAVKSVISLHMRQLEHEVFACLFLDNRHRLIRYQAMFNGTINSASVYPWEVVKAALAANAAAVVLRVNRLIKQLTDQATIFGVICIFETPDHKISWWSIEKGYNGFANGAVAA